MLQFPAGDGLRHGTSGAVAPGPGLSESLTAHGSTPPLMERKEEEDPVGNTYLLPVRLRWQPAV